MAIFINNYNSLKPTLIIRYCPKCNWLIRSSYLAQELLHTFEEDLNGVFLQPSEVAGEFTILTGDLVIFDRKANGGFVDTKIIKQLVRDCICPNKSLGHSDK